MLWNWKLDYRLGVKPLQRRPWLFHDLKTTSQRAVVNLNWRSGVWENQRKFSPEEPVGRSEDRSGFKQCCPGTWLPSMQQKVFFLIDSYVCRGKFFSTYAADVAVNRSKLHKSRGHNSTAVKAGNCIRPKWVQLCAFVLRIHLFIKWKENCQEVQKKEWARK